jgi:hypothetical protein
MTRKQTAISDQQTGDLGTPDNADCSRRTDSRTQNLRFCGIAADSDEQPERHLIFLPTPNNRHIAFSGMPAKGLPIAVGRIDKLG